ncbi:AAA family ATPase [Octadecabacter sp. 1_MG-2023]|uniref:helix-turn-helix transcriptional regulator n=1 Tax=unclassified Octadecabacter TaxID=196158 RepID=UPI001C08D1C7|nr:MULTISPECIES: AAA family ATPase [unclassified Octadecabacter]MBU2993317.1 AAA family ATPase [Octadecabacter sp. B2R22]MDO6733227.1 AAA family ATPase [Octadecabacter sp. 1_MG-2023]
MIVERDAELDMLSQILASIPQAGGRLVLVRGESGIGKSTFIEHFLSETSMQHQIAIAWCDPLNTPRPLGPVRDLVAEVNRFTTRPSEEADYFEGFVAQAQLTALPLVLVIEDLHWADHKSLDWLMYVGRRLSQLPVLLLGSYRDDEIGPTHPLHHALSTISAARKTHIDLPSLSLNAVRQLDQHQKYSPEDVHRITGGHPFFVSEILCSDNGADTPPHSVADFINTRISSFPNALQNFLELISCVPGELKPSILDALNLKNTGALCDEGVAQNVLVPIGQDLKFRHELTRMAVCARMGPARKRESHALFLAAYLEIPELSQEFDRILFHAEGAQDQAAILTFAPLAADRAATLGAHREAAMFLGTALTCIDHATPEVAAHITEHWAYEAGLSLGIDDEVIAARERAVDLWTKLGRADRVGENLRWLSRLFWYRGEAKKAETYILQAIDVLDGEGLTAETGKAYAMRAQFFMLQDIMDEAGTWATRALAIAEQFGDLDTQAHALNTMGSAKLFRGDPEGETYLRQSLKIAHTYDLHEQAARVYTNLSECLIEMRELDRAEALLDEGIAYDTAHDLDAWTFYLVGRKAHLRFEQDRYDDAVQIAQSVLKQKKQTLLMQMPARIILARAKVRLGNVDAADLLDEAILDAKQIGEPQYLVTLLVAKIEQAVLQNDPSLSRDALALLSDMDSSVFSAAKRGDYQFWTHLVGEPYQKMDVPEPYALFLSGDYDAAAQAFKAQGANYLAGWVRVSQLDPEAADKIFETIGATGARRSIRKRFDMPEVAMRPRGRYRAAKAHPYELTGKEQAVLAMLADGKSNALIANELSRSPRTIENHVSSILSKLSCKNRLEVVLRTQSEPWILLEN